MIYVGPWLLQSQPFDLWTAPIGTTDCIDIRTLADQGTYLSNGLGIFSSDIVLDSNYRQFDAIPKEADRSIFAAMLGVKTVDGSTLTDWIASFLTLYADPFGQTACKPITPSGRAMEINLGGLIYSMPFDVNAAYCQPAISVMQQDYKHIASTDQALASKVLGFWGQQFSVNNPQDIFIPADMPKIPAATPATTFSDNFNRADNATLGTASGGWAWSNDVNSISLASNKAKQNTFGGSTVARAVANLSSADHSAQADVNSNNTSISYFALGTVTRKIASAVQTYYLGLVDFNAQVAKLFKCVSGSFTQLGSNVAVSLSVNTDYTILTKSSGSTQSFNLAGVQKISQTDSAITGNLQTGIRGDASAGQSANTATWDNFVASDLTAGISFDASSNSGDQASVSTFTFSRTVQQDNPFLSVDVGLLSTPSATVSVLDDDGGGNVPMQFLGQQVATGIGLISMWGLANPVAGTKNIRVNLSTSLTSGAVATIYGGVDQAGPTEAFNSAQGLNVGAANASVTVTPVTDKTWIHAATATNDPAATNNQTSRGTVTDATFGSVLAEDGNAAVTPAAATTMTAAVAALKAWAIGGYAIRPTGNDPLLMGQALL